MFLFFQFSIFYRPFRFSFKRCNRFHLTIKMSQCRLWVPDCADCTPYWAAKVSSDLMFPFFIQDDKAVEHMLTISRSLHILYFCGSVRSQWVLFPCRSLVAGAGVCFCSNLLDHSAADRINQKRLLFHSGPVQTRVPARVWDWWVLISGIFFFFDVHK